MISFLKNDICQLFFYFELITYSLNDVLVTELVKMKTNLKSQTILQFSKKNYLVMHSLYIQIKQFEDLCHLNQSENIFFI